MSTSPRRPEPEAPDLQEYVATTIPVHVEIDVHQTVLNLAEAETILREASSIALGPCACRTEAQRCDAPVNVCLSLNESSIQAVNNEDGFEYVDVETAMDALRASHEAGLVHLAFRKPGAQISEFCSCCSCCCWFLTKLKAFDYHHAVIESSHIARHVPEACTACGTCARVCPFGAWSFSESDSWPVLAADKCFGCGVCVSACPSHAIAFDVRSAV
jgi:NAD-dependent dihydropyrimidine dehydrogenase PreA subunit